MVEQVTSGNEQFKGISFEDLLTEWHGLKEGDERHYVVANARGVPVLKRNQESGEKENVLLVIKAEAKHELDENNKPVRTGLSYTAYEWGTNFADVRMLNAYWDDEYFEESAERNLTYVPLKDVVLSKLPKRPPVAPPPLQPRTPEPPPLPPPKPEEKLQPGEMPNETAETVAAYQKRIDYILTGDIPDSEKDAEFLRELHERFAREELRFFRDTALVQTLNEDVDIVQELKISPGLVLVHGKSSLRGKDIHARLPKDPKPVATLGIRFLQSAQPMARKQTVAEWTGEQLLRAAAITKFIRSLDDDDANRSLPYGLALRGLQKRGYKQVRLEVLSHRYRGSLEHGEAERYRIFAQLFGNEVPSAK